MVFILYLEKKFGQIRSTLKNQKTEILGPNPAPWGIFTKKQITWADAVFDSLQ